MIECLKRAMSGLKAWAYAVWHSSLFLAVCAVWMGGMLVGGFAPRIDAYFRPAVSSFSIDRAESFRRGDAMFLTGTMVKNRCRFLAVNVTGYSNDADPIPLPILFQDSNGDETANRPRGPNEWGPWRIGILAKPEIWGVRMQASHLCGNGLFSWTIITDLGPLIVLESIRVRP